MAFIILGSIGLAWITPWPAQFTRYLITLAPFLAICVVLPLAKVGVLFHARHLRWAASLARTSFAGILVLAFATEIYTSLNSFRWRVTNKEAVVLPQSGNAAYRLFSHDHSWQAWEEAASWISAHAPSDAIIATSVPHFLYLRIGRRAVLPPMESDPVRARRLLEAVPISYVIVDTLAFLDVSRRYAFPAVQNDPATWRLVYSVRGADIYERATSRE
jgi:hypothetical protein